MAFDLPPLRIALYFTLGLFSFVLFCLSAARIHYTTHLPAGDPLNGGHNFYDPVIAELIFTTLITMGWCIYIIFVIHKRIDDRPVTLFRDEMIGLGVLWLFWLIGSAVASSIWGNLGFCQQFGACRLLSALLAFAWLGWIILSVLLVLSILFSFANGALMEPLHGRWDPRASRYRDSHATFPGRPMSTA
ncbi:hypothetical protein BDN71DRAFT_1451242 [Pleurotus eryngii]|uniref:MARVEL domain-containing protein n=1 Tax=Pleurotus eryngii TaxID=5323 RepID=A0A9P6DDB1_PLEER|nr:hypothetical protein BDN71DRAFT_1451242 [Pleurotus eryngii]